MSQSTFKRNAHVAFFKRCLSALPQAAEEHDANRYVLPRHAFSSSTFKLNQTNIDLR